MGELNEWPRWLPSPGLRALETHFVPHPGQDGVCGAAVMWAAVGHPTMTRPRCAWCLRIRPCNPGNGIPRTRFGVAHRVTSVPGGLRSASSAVPVGDL
jgi:hypothetical protein